MKCLVRREKTLKVSKVLRLLMVVARLRMLDWLNPRLREVARHWPVLGIPRSAGAFSHHIMLLLARFGGLSPPSLDRGCTHSRCQASETWRTVEKGPRSVPAATSMWWDKANSQDGPVSGYFAESRVGPIQYSESIEDHKEAENLEDLQRFFPTDETFHEIRLVRRYCS